MMTISEIQDNLRNGMQSSPQELAQMHSTLAGEYSFLSGVLEDIEQAERLFWEENIELTGIELERKFSHSEKGTEKKILRHRLQAISKMLSSLNMRVRIMMEESRNII